MSFMISKSMIIYDIMSFFLQSVICQENYQNETKSKRCHAIRYFSQFLQLSGYTNEDHGVH